jgi:hypothetical protein
LQQKAGVAKADLPRLVLKELCDNGLDEGGEVTFGRIPNGGYFIEDDGRGIEGTPQDIAGVRNLDAALIQTSRDDLLLGQIRDQHILGVTA